MKSETSFSWKIDGRTSPVLRSFKELWEYRDLLMLLVRRDFVAFYKQTILGPIWFFLQPMLTTIIFTLVFGKLGGFKTDGLPQPLFYLAGITAWNYFSDCLTKTSTVFRDNAGIFGKVYFPRLIMPLSIVISNLLRFGVQMLLLIIMIMVYVFYYHVPVHPTSYILLFPLLVLIMAVFGLGFGIIISSMTTKYRDLSFLVTFGVQLLMYATTVVFPLSAVGEKFRWIVELHPMTYVIEGFRLGFLGHGSFSWYGLLYTGLVSASLLLVGFFVFNKVERNFVDTI